MLLMQFILEIVEQFADTLNVYKAEQNCCKMKVMLKQKGIFSSWNLFGAYADIVIIITSCGNTLSTGILIRTLDIRTVIKFSSSRSNVDSSVTSHKNL